MEDFSSLIDSYTEFLSVKTAKKKDNLQGSLISFVKDIDKFNFENKLDSLLKSSENSFYLSSPENEFSFVAIDSALSITENGPARFTATDKKAKDVFSKIISNGSDESLPLIVGGMKFTVEHSDDDWKDFYDSNWFVPEIIICKNFEKTYIVYNNYIETGFSKTKLAEKFAKKLNSVFKAGEESSSSPRITNSAGLSPKDKKKWKQVISQALEKIDEKAVKKVVLARKIDLTLSDEINLTNSLNTLRRDYPGCCIFAFHKGSSTFFGATPELLAKVFDHKIEIDAIAGSISRSESGDEDSRLEADLLNSRKNLNEHQFVLEHLFNALKNIGKNIVFNEKPSVKKLKNIQHLSTKISADLKDDTSLMTILKELHPTPAVCGFPKEPALNLIKKIENQRRGLYSGIIGWFNQGGKGEFAVSIRSAITKGNKLTAYAGGGIVEGSEPDTEFEETEMKLKPILSLFNEKKD